MCEHANFEVHCLVRRLSDTEGGPITSYGVDVTIKCADCLIPFEFVGVGIGLSPVEPLTDVGRLELRAPIVPQGSEPNPGLPGYRMVVRGREGILS